MSSAIKYLEGDLGLHLFVRQHKRVALTEAGQRFYSDVAMGLGHIARSAEAVRRATEDKHVVLSSSTAFASHWLIPRLPIFRAQHPEIEIRIQTADRDTDLGPDPYLIASVVGWAIGQTTARSVSAARTLSRSAAPPT
ncbi:LysR substrate-binding domain-containing protein [Mesorhizobium sp. M0013]|uniref:LysR substrate-binding domain-containing protein n=1 Tax=Mesorhizobium sp. M0013 TaxID=2956841 RepID=UPI00333B941B